jgi:cellulose synthase/poly-beta-1,6-N-acetylglucosamine synthase-like glycosyltransferase
MLHDVLFWLALASAVLAVGTLAQLLTTAPRIPRLERVPPLGDAEMPSISIVVAARNEARGIEGAMRSLLALDVPRLEVVAVDDRSDDATGELLLFTDADVEMAPDTLRRAAALVSADGLDHLAAGMHVDMPGWLLQTFGVWFGVMFALFTRPWKAKDPRSRAHVGVGAFNLLRAEAYRRIGTHRAIAMRPDDDMKLGKLVKKHGLRQDFVDAMTHVRVEWYHSLREALRGLRKNGFAGVDYRLWLVLLVTVLHPVFFIWPYLAVWVTHGPTRWLNAAAVAMALGVFAGAARQQRVRWWYGAAYPLASLLFLAAIWNAPLYALIHRGIEWRGTHYPLDQLKANRV